MFQWDGELMNKWYAAYAISWFFWMYQYMGAIIGVVFAVLSVQQSVNMLSGGGKEKEKKKR
jgi:hypothetical protein